MVRRQNDVDISNVERATIANDAQADAFIRIHVNGSEDSTINGVMTICQTSGNPYNSALYQQSRAFAKDVLEGITTSTGCRKECVWETDTMSGINWWQVPVAIAEVGYMINAEEDVRLATNEYQQQIVIGIADGIDRFFSNDEK